MKIDSRRGFFKSLAVLALAGVSTQTVYAKPPKKQFKYQDTPKDGKKCVDCVHFLPKTNECKVVAGNIDPKGWCTLYNEGAK